MHNANRALCPNFQTSYVPTIASESERGSKNCLSGEGIFSGSFHPSSHYRTASWQCLRSRPRSFIQGDLLHPSWTPWLGKPKWNAPKMSACQNDIFRTLYVFLSQLNYTFIIFLLSHTQTRRARITGMNYHTLFLLCSDSVSLCCPDLLKLQGSCNPLVLRPSKQRGPYAHSILPTHSFPFCLEIHYVT